MKRIIERITAALKQNDRLAHVDRSQLAATAALVVEEAWRNGIGHGGACRDCGIDFSCACDNNEAPVCECCGDYLVCDACSEEA